MKTRQIEEIAAILPQERTKYLYFKDKYALDLLSWLLDEHAVAEVKASQFSGLLKKPVVREAMSYLGGSRLSGSDFENVWGAEVIPYLLTIGSWGTDRHKDRGWYQTTGRDANLVLQLNFSNVHNAAYRTHVDDTYRPFEFSAHPVARWPFRTLAWARLDLCFELDEALIEEVQTDWIRYGSRRYDYLNSLGGDLSLENRKVLRYLKDVLLPYAALWQETILSAALWFIHRELGISKVYYHTHASGCALKRIDTQLPPRSLYEALPRKFCFKRVREIPQFLKADIKRKLDPEFYLLDFKRGLNQ